MVPQKNGDPAVGLERRQSQPVFCLSDIRVFFKKAAFPAGFKSPRQDAG